MRDPLSLKRLQKLHPLARPVFQKFIEECENTLDISLRITQGLRTFEEQQELYNQGRTKPGKVVTNARAGSSYHNYGLAVDLVHLPKEGGINWGYDMSKLAAIAKKYEIGWGGDFKTIVDKPHFEYTHGLSVKALLELHTAKRVDEAGYVKLQ